MAIKILSRTLNNLGFVTIRCRRCSEPMGRWPFSGIATATCTTCQALEKEEEELLQQKTADDAKRKVVTTPVIATTQQPIVHQIKGENFTIVTGQPTEQPAPTEDFNTLAEKLMRRTKRKSK